jgi:glycine dehydrogenase
MAAFSSVHRFEDRHIGPSQQEQAEMLAALGVDSLDALTGQAVPAEIQLKEALNLPEPVSEAALLRALEMLAGRNRVLKSYIGMGYYDCVTPPPIQRLIFENPAWYTPYTPYQAEIAQGRLESLMNFQTMVIDLTGLDVANASLLDEATAAAEAMTLLHRTQPRRQATRHRCLVSQRVFPQVRGVLETRAAPLGIELVFVDPAVDDVADELAFGLILQVPDDYGAVRDVGDVIARAQAAGVRVAMGTDLLALTLIKPPGEMGADIAYGSAQRFGVPLGYGGPHAAFFATRDALKRELPGRVVGVSVDQAGRTAYRLALQTREQHIRREKATSNICTAQALLANMAAMYAVYHGPEGLRGIAEEIHRKTCHVRDHLAGRGVKVTENAFFDTLRIDAESLKAVSCEAGNSPKGIAERALQAGINLRCFEDGSVGISIDETTGDEDVARLLAVFGVGVDGSAVPGEGAEAGGAIPADVRRTSAFLTHPVFHQYRSETELMRYIKQLERKDVGLDTSMIPLGSCTMKLNAAVEMMPLSWAGFSRLHPFVPLDQAAGYQQVLAELEAYVREVTGFAAVSLQPNAGAQGEYAGLLAIRDYHLARGDPERRVALIPSSAHGTNPASAIMAGMQVVVVACDAEGAIDFEDLQAKVAEHRDQLAALMVTYPSTFGVFEARIREVTALVHEAGGQVYMDGANLNAQVGVTSPAAIGADVCHLNMHKTFAIPHGGGGPGMGPIGVAAHLAAYLPGHPVVPLGTAGKRTGAVSAAPWGSASILLISYAYMRLLGPAGLRRATQVAILNANYIKHRLEAYFPVHYSGAQGRVAHELIFDLRPVKARCGVTETDVAKRLMDFGFHAPTVSWPVPGTMMIEPTESESKAELDRFCDAMVAIHGEIEAIASGEVDGSDHLLAGAPHTAEEVCGDEWSHPYSRAAAAFPLPYVRANKVWPAVGRIDNAHGDRHLVCSCPPLSEYSA